MRGLHGLHLVLWGRTVTRDAVTCTESELGGSNEEERRM